MARMRSCVGCGHAPHEPTECRETVGSRCECLVGLLMSDVLQACACGAVDPSRASHHSADCRFAPEMTPTVAQWARAEAFGHAITWVGVIVAGVGAGMPARGAESLVGYDIETLALRWARIIETGEVPEGEES